MSRKDIQFSVDLITSALNELDFLESIDKIKSNFTEDLLFKAVFRYEKYWLPFYQKNRNEVFPPYDVAWIWHCHMLAPQEYNYDLKNLLNEVLNHTNSNREEIFKKQENTKQLWESEFNVSFDYLNPNSVDSEFSDYKTKLRYNLIEASKRQLEFYYQVSLPHYRNKNYLAYALDRYKKFLNLKRENPSLFIVPCYSIDLIWHTHQLNPLEYKADLDNIIGALLEHDDSLIDRTPGQKLDKSGKETAEKWKELYNEEFFFPGAMFRGNRPTSNDYSHSLGSKLVKFTLKEVKLMSKIITVGYKTSFKFNLYKIISNGTRESLISEQQIDNEETLNDFDSIQLYSTETENFELEVVYLEEKISSKVLNVLKSGHRHDTAYDKILNFKLDRPEKFNSNEEQNIEFDLESPKKDSFTLMFKWNICSYPNDIQLNMQRDDFHYFKINQMKHLFKNFSLEKINFDENENALKAEHKLIASPKGSASIQFKDFYIIEIMHIIPLEWSSVRVIQNEKLLASAKLINLQQLPSDSLLSPREALCLNLNYEKAMLITNLNGDYAIVKAKWVDYTKSNPGRLLVNFYSISQKKSQVISVSNSSIFDISSENINANVNLKTSQIQLSLKKSNQNDLEIESLLATVFSIAILHVILQPKESPSTKNNSNTNNNNHIKQNNPSNPTIVIKPTPINTNHVMINSIGYNDLINSNYYHYNYCNEWTCTNPHHSHYWHNWCHHDHHHHYHDHHHDHHFFHHDHHEHHEHHGYNNDYYNDGHHYFNPFPHNNDWFSNNDDNNDKDKNDGQNNNSDFGYNDHGNNDKNENNNNPNYDDQNNNSDFGYNDYGNNDKNEDNSNNDSNNNDTNFNYNNDNSNNDSNNNDNSNTNNDTTNDDSGANNDSSNNYSDNNDSSYDAGGSNYDAGDSSYDAGGSSYDAGGSSYDAGGSSCGGGSFE